MYLNKRIPSYLTLLGILITGVGIFAGNDMIEEGFFRNVILPIGILLIPTGIALFILVRNDNRTDTTISSDFVSTLFVSAILIYFVYLIFFNTERIAHPGDSGFDILGSYFVAPMFITVNCLLLAFSSFIKSKFLLLGIILLMYPLVWFGMNLIALIFRW